MPNVQYECQKCGYIKNIYQQDTQTRSIQCPLCRINMQKTINTGAKDPSENLVHLDPIEKIIKMKKQNE